MIVAHTFFSAFWPFTIDEPCHCLATLYACCSLSSTTCRTDPRHSFLVPQQFGGFLSMRAMENSRQRMMQEQENNDVPDATNLVYDVASMPGFRFQPTEEELVGFYLRSMVVGNRLEVELINVLDLYRYDPWELPAMAFMQGEREWLFFCPRDKKYPNGARPNRVTASGYWKATGTDRQVRRAHDSRCIGLKKTLVFYTGKAPRGHKTEWIMNEYRLPQSEQILRKSCVRKDPREVALCRIYKKPVHNPALCAHAPDSMEDLVETSTYYPSAERSKRMDRAAPESEQASASTSGTSPAPPRSPCRFTPCRRSIFYDEADMLCDTQASCSRSVKLEDHGPSLSSIRNNLAPDNVQDTLEALLSAQLMQAEANRRRSIFAYPADDEIQTTTTTTSSDVNVSVSVSADRFSWLRQDDCCANITLPGESPSLVSQAAGGNTLSSLQSIDRLLKSSVISPSVPHSLLADKDDNVHLPLSNSLFATHLGPWNSCQPAWLQTISPGRQPLLSSFE